MRQVSVDLAAHLQSGRSVYFVDLYTFTLLDGTVMRWTGGEVPIAWQNRPYLLGPKMQRGELKYSVGLQTDTLKLEFFPEETNFKTATPATGPAPIVVVPPVGAVPLRQALLRGDFDGATVELSRGVAAAPVRFHGSTQEVEAIVLSVGGNVLTVDGNELAIAYGLQAVWPLLDVVPRFTGRMGRITGGGFSVSCEARSILSLLDQPFPRNVYTPSCGNTLFDSICGLVRPNYRVLGSVVSITGRMSFTTGLAQADEYFRLGVLKFLTGGNAGRQYPVQHNVAGVVTLARPPVANMTVGDTFEIYPGCDKTLATCGSKYNNVVRFRGQPFVPAVESIL